MSLTVKEITDSYIHSLISPLGSRQGACPTCHGLRGEAFKLCYQCNQALQELGDGVADIVVPISLAVSFGGQHDYRLLMYKNPSHPKANLFRIELAAFLRRFLNCHEECIKSVLGIPRFDILATVPSSSGRSGLHPLAQLVKDYVAPDRFEDVLELSDLNPASHSPSKTLFRTHRDLQASSVLLIEDTWTTGANVQSAAYALKQAAATFVGVIALGRWFHADVQDPKSTDAGREYVNLAKNLRPFRWDRCCIDWDEAELGNS